MRFSRLILYIKLIMALYSTLTQDLNKSMYYVQ